MAPDEQDLVFTLEDANALRRSIGDSVRAVRRSETTPEGQIEALGFLARDGAHSIAALARLRRVRHQSMRVTVADLEAQGLVERAPDPADARGVLVSLTPAGLAVVAESRTRRAGRVLAAAEAALTPEERAVLAKTAPVLEKLTAALLAEDVADAQG
ncbi:MULTISPECIES: MarR family winged helix-turn-helix transcriptional regulator [unclassified Curtobacterium]|uniref:MarR family winged helix-turn-helix transcriptional regulator n=1 Tax=unclassified Curtobacterium TaxID=257496 RepID=UPI00226B09D4|nr:MULTISPECIES: MarR family transcriptional regulator [unclassified Curtobacterium]